MTEEKKKPKIIHIKDLDKYMDKYSKEWDKFMKDKPELEEQADSLFDLPGYKEEVEIERELKDVNPDLEKELRRIIVVLRNDHNYPYEDIIEVCLNSLWDVAETEE